MADTFIAQIIAEDEPDEGALYTIGPYDTWDKAQEAGDALLAVIQEDLPDHEWDAIVEQVKTLQQALEDQEATKARIAEMVKNNPEFFNP